VHWSCLHGYRNTSNARGPSGPNKITARSHESHIHHPVATQSGGSTHQVLSYRLGPLPLPLPSEGLSKLSAVSSSRVGRRGRASRRRTTATSGDSGVATTRSLRRTSTKTYGVEEVNSTASRASNSSSKRITSTRTTASTTDGAWRTMSVIAAKLRRSTTSTTRHEELTHLLKTMERTLINALLNVIHLIERRVFGRAETR
jgi:hypothetical protein